MKIRNHLAAVLSAVALGAPIGTRAAAGAPPSQAPLPVRGLCIQAPSAKGIPAFIEFIDGELAPRGVNTLILRVDYGFQFASHPEMADPGGLSRENARELLAACRRHHIHLTPLVNLLGHQSWESSCGRLLQAHPEFDETPQVKFPKTYAWPNADRLYCKSYCPSHPGVHEFVFGLIDEVCEAFEADAFHAGMDEVFYIGEEQCPRCRGKNKARLFAGEVRAIHDHLQPLGRRLWLWGDRLLDGATTGLGEWEASRNGTQDAIDLVPRDIVICDWHYERPEPTAVYFAMKGLDVVSCGWKNPEAAAGQVRDMARWREVCNDRMKEHFQGVVHTVWSGAEGFVKSVAAPNASTAASRQGRTEAEAFRRIFEELNALPPARPPSKNTPTP
jgi:hypothetical protein